MPSEGRAITEQTSSTDRGLEISSAVLPKSASLGLVEMHIRAPVLADAEAIARAHVRAWQAAYRGLMPGELLDGLSVDERALGWRRRIEHDDGSGLFAAILEDLVVGFAAFGQCRDADEPGIGELYAINLDPDAWGLGLGRQLFRSACDGLDAMGFERQMLWVVEENERARRLYDSEGWIPDGQTKTDENLGSITEVRYERSRR